mmetsp:Transcript_34800/g.90252  ORF Transcript_34800/g.90252 Transcript_34800/m.90252 type:complete len:81 (-) Transcript_34800:221-463(-)
MPRCCWALQQSGGQIHFKIKKQTVLMKLFDAFCKRIGTDPASIVFFRDNERVDLNKTAEELNLEDGDIIDAREEVQGAHD